MPTEPVVRTPVLDQPILKVGGELFDRWKNVSISMDIDSLAASFDMSVGPLLTGDTDWVKTLAPGNLVEIYFGRVTNSDALVLRGVIDSQSIRSSGTDEILSISGRDVMSLLADASMWLNIPIEKKTLQQIATEVIQRFKFADGTAVFQPTVDYRGSDRKATRNTSRPSSNQTCERYLSQLAADQELSLWSSPDGQLTIGDRKTERDDQQAQICFYTFRSPTKAHQNNLKETQVSRSIVDGFSEYRVYGRVATGSKRTAVSKQDIDPTVPVYRTRSVRLENADDAEAVDRHAASEKEKGLTNRFQLSGTAVGFGQLVDGKAHLFRINQRIKVLHEVAGVDGEFYIAKLNYTCDASSGPQTSLTFRPLDPETFGFGL